MLKKEMLSLAEKELKRADYAYKHNYKRPGITTEERINLLNKIYYRRVILHLIEMHTEEDFYEIGQT